MPQLDRFLQVMTSNDAESMVLAESEVATLQIAGAPRAITKQPLTAAQLEMLLKEIAPESVGVQLGERKPTSFTYRSEHGEFAVKTAMNADRLHASIVPHPSAPVTAPAAAAPAPVSLDEVSVKEPAPKKRKSGRVSGGVSSRSEGEITE